MTIKIACFGGGGLPNAKVYEEMKEVGRLLAERKVTVVTGAYSGIMTAAAEGAKSAAGKTMGYTHSGKEANQFIDTVIDCKKLSSEFPFPADYGIRLSGLLSANGFIFAAGGGIGTFLELIAAILFQQKFWSKQRMVKRIAILRPTSAQNEIEGWDNEMLERLIEWQFLTQSVRSEIAIAPSADGAVDWVVPHY